MLIRSPCFAVLTAGLNECTIILVGFKCSVINQKQNQAQSACGESTHKGVNYRSKYVTQTQQQRHESPTVEDVPLVECMYLVVTVGDSGLCCCTCVTYLER